MGLDGNCFFLKSDMSSEREKAAENKQRKNQFARIRMLQTEVGEHLYVIYSLVMLTFRTDDSDNTGGFCCDFWSRTR